VLFSAATPFHGGCNHVNDQFSHYWDDTDIHRWLRQNIPQLAHVEALAANESVRATQGTAPLAVVHPDYRISPAQSVAQ
jgi:hypothetical protein